MPTRSVFRVLRWLPRAPVGAPGHPLFVPADRQGAGRIDNPNRYTVFYASDHPAGAIAEALGGFRTWTSTLFERTPRAPQARLALASFTIDDDAICDLDDGHALHARGIRPSEVVSKDRPRTQRWAATIFDEQRWIGASWWSFYDSRWTSIGIWRADGLQLIGSPEPLTLSSPAVAEAAAILNRPLFA